MLQGLGAVWCFTTYLIARKLSLRLAAIHQTLSGPTRPCTAVPQQAESREHRPPPPTSEAGLGPGELLRQSSGSPPETRVLQQMAPGGLPCACVGFDLGGWSTRLNILT